LIWYSIDEDGEDQNFMGVKQVYKTSLALFPL